MDERSGSKQGSVASCLEYCNGLAAHIKID
jgi:hypothetical protein